MQKSESFLFCNLCFKKFNCNDAFLHHIDRKHLPEIGCDLCDETYICGKLLDLHVKNDHISDAEIMTVFKLFDVVESANAHTTHAQEWIRRSFAVTAEDALKRKELRDIVKRSINAEAKVRDGICQLCADEKFESVKCCYCKLTYMHVCHLKKHILSVHLVFPPSLERLVKWRCELCRRVCSSKKHLALHQKNVHNLQTKSESSSPFCHFCGKCLANSSNLKRHIVNQHGEEIGVIPECCEFTCDHCKCLFSNKSSIRRHIENLHVNAKDTKKSISCFQCEQRFNSIRNLNMHLSIEHSVTINEQKVTFCNMNAFWEWKKEEEIRSNARFVQLRGLRRQRKKGEEILSLKFVCNRSGMFHSKSNGKRAYRIKGSSKIGRYCSSYIEVIFKDNGSVEGIYCSTHSGHDNDLRYLALTMEEKKEIYEKIKSGVSFSAILNEIRNSVGKEIKRKHLVTNKDLHNIVTTFRKTSETSEVSSTTSSATSVPEQVHVPTDQVSCLQKQFQTDMDVCTDLWVETCQQMMDRFDENKVDGKTDIEHKSYSGQKVMADSTVSSNYMPFDYDPRFYESQRDFPSDFNTRIRSDFEAKTQTNYDVQIRGGFNARVHSAHVEHAESYGAKIMDELDDDCGEVDALSEDDDETTSELTSNELVRTELETCKKPTTSTKVCDLKDRVNSVTALFNIVESELDDRKKTIIRNYVDNMFRVLQYRYNKSKSKSNLKKTKKNTKKPRTATIIQPEAIPLNSTNQVTSGKSDLHFLRWN